MAEEENKQEVEEQTQDEIEVVEEVVNENGSEDKKEEVQENQNKEKSTDEKIEDKVADAKAEKKDETKRSKDELYEEIELPEGVSAEISEDILVMKKEDKEISRKLVPLIDFKVEGNKIIISNKRGKKVQRRLFGTFRAHINNMVKGLTEGFEYKLKIANVHFPMNASYDDNKKEFTIKNFLGEKKDRVIKLIPDVEVKIDNEDVIVSSYDIEKAGQVATKIEKGAKVRNKDRRIYQDGIFIVEKPGRVYL